MNAKGIVESAHWDGKREAMVFTVVAPKATYDGKENLVGHLVELVKGKSEKEQQA